ncbi:MAG: hypothetical protein ACI8P0_000387 [Planctomycetaceae bacterium]|jgi:hypothetical protein
MTTHRVPLLCSLLVLSLVVLPHESFAQNTGGEDDVESPKSPAGLTAGDALKAAFTPITVTGYRGYTKPGSRGMAQKRVLELTGANKNIQVAFVLDGTSSMSNDIESLRERLTDVVNGLRSQVTSTDPENVSVEVALVVYRDLVKEYKDDNWPVWNESPVQVFPSTGEFLDFDDEDEQQELTEYLTQLKADGGAPYFSEQVDRGLDEALKLDWSLAAAVTKVIFLAGDAPPFDEALVRNNPDQLEKSGYGYWSALVKAKPDTPTLRGFQTKGLIERARTQHITIHAVSCNTSIDTESVKAKLLRATQFFQEISNETGGGFLNLRDPGIVDRLLQISTGRVTSLVELKKFNFKDLVAQSSRDISVEPVKVAFLPLLPLDELDYREWYSHRSYQIVSSLSRTVREIDASLAFSGDDVRRAWTRIRGRVKTLDTAAALAELAKQLDADFVVWGSLDSETATLNVVDSRGAVIGPSQTVEGVSLAETKAIWSSISATIASADASENDDVTRFVSLTKNIDVDAAFDRDAGKPESLQLLNDAYMKLEAAAGYPLGQPEGQRLTRDAEKVLKQLLAQDADNAAALMLLASCAVNLENRDDLVKHLTLARKVAADLPDSDLLRLEIEGDYQLYVSREPVAAVGKYRQLLAAAPKLSKTALRANWILAGLFLGDWGVNPAKLYAGRDLSMKECQDHAQQHILAILVNWPASPEAQFYGRYIDPPVSKKRGSPFVFDPEDTLVAEQLEYQIRVPAARPASITVGLLNWTPPTENDSSAEIIN